MLRVLAVWIAIISLAGSLAQAQEQLTLTPSEQLNALAKKAVDEAVAKFKEQKLSPDDVSITLIDMRQPTNLQMGNFQGEKGIYPASVIKMFYLGAVHRALEDHKVEDSAELHRAMHDMIVDSNNDATNWLIEAITDAGNGPLLPDDQMKQWEDRRQSINRLYKSLGYQNINVCQKLNVESYGRDRIFFQDAKRNQLTTNATARLLATIALGKMVSPDRSKEMMELLHRDMTSKSNGSDDQAHGFSAMALPKDAKLWSKAGWTSFSRHDAAYIELPDGRKLVSVIFTTSHGNQKQILPDIVSRIIAGFE